MIAESASVAGLFFKEPSLSNHQSTSETGRVQAADDLIDVLSGAALLLYVLDVKRIHARLNLMPKILKGLGTACATGEVE